MPTKYDRVAYHDEHGQRKREYVPWSHANRSDPDPGHLTQREKVATQRFKKIKKHTELGQSDRNRTVSNLNAKCEQNILKKAKTFTLIELAHKTVTKTYSCDPKEFNKTDLDLPEMSPSFESPFKTKFSKMHNFAANHLCSKICYCEYGER